MQAMRLHRDKMKQDAKNNDSESGSNSDGQEERKGNEKVHRKDDGLKQWDDVLKNVPDDYDFVILSEDSDIFCVVVCSAHHVIAKACVVLTVHFESHLVSDLNQLMIQIIQLLLVSLHARINGQRHIATSVSIRRLCDGANV